MEFLGHSLLLSSHLGSYLSYFVILFFAFLDTLFLVGAFFPGSVFVVGAGFLSSISSLNIWISLIFVVLGGLFGDVITYFIGKYGSLWFKKDSKLLKIAYLENGKAFFNKHGSKSLILGRFMGVIKAVVPFVAGLIKMDFKKFLYLNTISSIIWGILYLGIGYIFGKTMNSFYLEKQLKFLIILIPFIAFIVWLIFDNKTKIINKFKSIFNL